MRKELFVIILVAVIFSFSEIRADFVDPHIYSFLNSTSTGQAVLGALKLNTGGAEYGLIVKSGLVGIGVENPKGALEVKSQNQAFLPPRMSLSERNSINSPEEGTVIYNKDTKKFNFWDGIEWEDLNSGDFAFSGTVSYFDSVCPPSWSELQNAKGRYIVGNPTGGNIGLTVGSALSNQESRPVGQHSHSAWQPPHNHTATFLVSNNGGIFNGWGWSTEITRATSSAQPPVHVANEGLVSGTNAPYIQFVVCRKN